MDIVGFWNKTITDWNTENKCGFCWEFEAPLKESQSNIIQANESCCASAILTGRTSTDTPRYSQNTGFLISVQEDNSFIIHVVLKSDLGTNNYTEIKGHPKEQSREETIFKPLKECLDRSEIEQLLCIYTGRKVDVTKWHMVEVHAYLDSNFYGWKINANFRLEK